MIRGIVDKALAGDKRSIARVLSHIESSSGKSQEIMKSIYPRTGRAHIIGITGSPGAGKSTLTGRIIASLRERGLSVGVIAVDPSSPYTGGAILGDRLRMQDHALDRGVFIRSMGSRGSLGGVSGATHEAALVMDACGMDAVIVETVGVGQSEIDIVKIADTVCLVLVPGMGDDVQIMKAGIMEIADIFVVNKADRDGAPKVASDVKVMLDLAGSRSWRPPVLLASAEKGTGITELVEGMEKHRSHLYETEEGAQRRRMRAETELEGILVREISKSAHLLWSAEKDRGALDDLAARKTDPYSLSSDILAKLNLSKNS